MRRPTFGTARVALATITAAALLLPAPLANAQTTAPPTTGDPAEAAAGWLARQLVDGERFESTFGEDTFPDYGLTADAVLAFASAEVAGDRIGAATDWLAANVNGYAGDGAETAWAGATAKLALVADVAGRDARDFGGADLVTRLLQREQPSGRFTDQSNFGDFSNVITQSLAIVALERTTDAGASQAAVDYLAGQACPDGGFPVVLEAETCESGADATGMAVQALSAAGSSVAAQAAGDWLVANQADDGSLGSADAAANANSTGLAAAALDVLGRTDAAQDARAWLIRNQDGCGDPQPGALPFSPQDRGDTKRATAQAVLGVAAVDLETLTATGTASHAPALLCFSDVRYDTNPHAPAISELVRRGAVRGRPGGTFGPAEALSRGQVATMIGSALGVEPVETTGFSDVGTTPHAGYVNALADLGIVHGYADDTYRPNQIIRRDQIAALLARWLELGPGIGGHFDDIAGNLYRDQINALAEIDVVNGTADGRYLPQRSLSREQAASMLVSALRWRETGSVDG